MALTISQTGDWSGIVGNRRSVRGTIAFDSSYPTGGESLTAANIGLTTIDHIEIMATSGYMFEYDYTNAKVLVYITATVTPAGTITVSTPTGTLSTPSFAIASSASASATYKLTVSADSTVAVIAGDSLTAARTLSGTYSPVGVPTFTGGAATGTFTGTATTAAALAEVGNATNLSSLTGVRFYAIGT